MSTLKEMAREYRVSAARLAMRIQEMKASGDADPYALKEMQTALRDIREVQRVLDGYYDFPRTDRNLTSAGWIGRGPSADDH